MVLVMPGHQADPVPSSLLQAAIHNTLRWYYGPCAVNEGNKCINIEGSGNRLPADVVVCLEYRRYLRFPHVTQQSYAPGIIFYTLNEGRP
jgi:hypothetical protein